MKNNNETIHFTKLNGQWICKDPTNLYNIIMNLSSVQTILNTCEMARFNVCEYTCVWNKRPYKATLQILKSSTYE